MAGMNEDSPGSATWLGLIGSALDDVSAGGSVGGRFAFQPDELAAIVSEWNDLAASYEPDLAAAEFMRRVEGPGVELASKSLASAANESGDALVESLLKERRYCILQAEKFQQALDRYSFAEQAVTDQMNKQHEGLA